MKDTFAFIANIITLLVFFGTIIFAIANTIWKKQCEKKYKISADFFTYANKTGVLFNVTMIILLNIIILSALYINYKDSLYNIKIRNTKESDGFNQELIVYNKDNVINYLYDSNKLLLESKESPNIIQKVNNFEGNRYCLTDNSSLKELDSNKIKIINNESEFEKGYKCLKFENNINKGENINTILQVPNNFKMSDIINYVNKNNLIKDLSVKPGYYVSWMIEDDNEFNTGEIEANNDDRCMKDFKDDTINLKYKEKLINNFYYINRKDSNKLVAFKKTDINWFLKIYIYLYMIVICAGIYLFYMNILKKHNAKLIDKKLNYIYILIFATSIFVCCFFILKHNSNNYLACNYDLLTVLILIISIIMFIYGAYLMTIFQKKSCVMIFCAVLGAIITFYTLWVLDLLIYILFNFYLLNIIVNVIIQTLAVMVGLVIILVSCANLFINNIILDLESKYKLIHINNKNNYLDIPEDLAVICEYKNKFLAVRYKAEEDELIKLYTDEYWFIDPSDCTIKEKSFKKELVTNKNIQLTCEAEKDGKEFRYWSDASDSTKVYTDETITAENLNNKVLYAQYDKPIIIEDNGQKEPDEGYKFVTFNFNGGKKDGKLVGPVKLQALIGLNLSDVVAKFDEGNFNNIVPNKTDIDQDITN